MARPLILTPKDKEYQALRDAVFSGEYRKNWVEDFFVWPCLRSLRDVDYLADKTKAAAEAMATEAYADAVLINPVGWGDFKVNAMFLRK
jgi:hypothetical protein